MQHYFYRRFQNNEALTSFLNTPRMALTLISVVRSPNGEGCKALTAWFRSEEEIEEAPMAIEGRCPCGLYPLQGTSE